MEKVTKVTEEAIRRYFDSLFKFGYKKYADVERLLVLTYIDELLEYDLFGFMTEEDYNIIMRALGCLVGSTCIIDFPSYATYNSLIRKQTMEINPRVDETGIFRVCEASLMRVKM